jgi:hypothetical protein
MVSSDVTLTPKFGAAITMALLLDLLLLQREKAADSWQQGKC